MTSLEIQTKTFKLKDLLNPLEVLEMIRLKKMAKPYCMHPAHEGYLSEERIDDRGCTWCVHYVKVCQQREKK